MELRGPFSALLLNLFLLPAAHSAALPFQEIPDRPQRGCHKTGFIRLVEQAGCEDVEVAVNVCRGHCPSLSVPASERQLLPDDDFPPVTSFSQCCRIANHTMVEVTVQCNEGPRTINIASATKCECFDCHHGHASFG